jgi:hypothetical protein
METNMPSVDIFVDAVNKLTSYQPYPIYWDLGEDSRFRIWSLVLGWEYAPDDAPPDEFNQDGYKTIVKIGWRDKDQKCLATLDYWQYPDNEPRAIITSIEEAKSILVQMDQMWTANKDLWMQ